MNARFRQLLWAVGLLVTLVLLCLIAGRVPGQLDLSDEQVYTLSPATKRILRSLEEPVTLRFYFSRGLPDVPTAFKNYATRVEDIARQFERASRGKLRLEVINPEPFSEKEEAALRAGVQSFALPSGDTLFFGMQSIQADQEATATFPPDRERFLEYDLAELIQRTRQRERPTLALMTDLPMTGAMGNPMMGAAPAWLVYRELERSYTLKVVAEGGDAEADAATLTEAAVLLVLGVENPAPEELFAIDQFLLSGRPVVVAVDPAGYMARNSRGGGMMMMPSSGQSDLPELFAAYGIDFDVQQVVGDAGGAMQVPVDEGRRSMVYPFFFEVSEFDDDAAATTGLSSVQFLEPGSVGLSEGSALTFQRLIETTTMAGAVPAGPFAGADISSAARLARDFAADGTRRTLAALFQGRFATAFPDGRPTATEPETDPATSEKAPGVTAAPSHLREGESLLVVIADTDFLADALVGQEINFLGQQMLQLRSDNLPFLQNVVDRLAGSPELIALRGKGRNRRPFELIDRIRTEADASSRAEIDALSNRLTELQSELDQLEQDGTEGARLVASAAVEDARRRFLQERADVQAEIRRIGQKTRDQIRGWKTGLAAVNILTVPLLVGAAGAFYLSRRARRRP